MNFSFYLKLAFLLILFVCYSHSFAQSETLPIKNKKYSISWTLSYEQGKMRGKGTEPADELARSTTYQGLDLLVGFNNNDHSDVYNHFLDD